MHRRKSSDGNSSSGFNSRRSSLHIETNMNDLIATNTRLKLSLENHERHLSEQLAQLDSREATIMERINKLNGIKAESAKVNGIPDAADGDHIGINAGGRVITARRSALTQLKDTMLEALFSGRWEQTSQKDSHGRIFLDVNPDCFQAIVDYLNEITISSDSDPPDPPSVDDELKHILQHQMELFGLLGSGMDSKIVKDRSHVSLLHEWLGENGSDGEFHLLYRNSRDRRPDAAFHPDFHAKCDGKKCTVTVIETTCGMVLGGYTNASWQSKTDGYQKADKAFLFILSGCNKPIKLKLKNKNDSQAIYNEATYGPAFGGAHDLYVQGNYVFPQLVGHTYETCPRTPQKLLEGEGFKIKEMEVFQIVAAADLPKDKVQTNVSRPIDKRLSDDVSEALNAKRSCLLQAELEVLHLENSFEDEQAFITKFACGDNKDVIALNISGTVMTTKRCVLVSAENSVLATQFDDDRWTEQSNATRVKEWTPDDVANWASNIEGIKEDVGSKLKENDISGPELLALTMEGLKMMGIEKIGTMCLIQKEIKELEKVDDDSLTLIEHSPYCFGKILDFLRLRYLHSQGLAEEPALPTVCDTQRKRFEKVVRYYFPDDESAKFFLGD